MQVLNKDKLSTAEEIARIEGDLAAIKRRNDRVDADKAWETSATRVSLICMITYAVAGILLCVLGNDRPWLSAFVPVVGFFLSSRTIAYAKARWLANRYVSKRGQDSSSDPSI